LIYRVLLQECTFFA